MRAVPGTRTLMNPRVSYRSPVAWIMVIVVKWLGGDRLDVGGMERGRFVEEGWRGIGACLAVRLARRLLTKV